VLLAELHIGHLEKVFTALLKREGLTRGDRLPGARHAAV